MTELEEIIEAGALIVRAVLKDVADYSSGKLTKADVEQRFADHRALIVMNRKGEDSEIDAKFPR